MNKILFIILILVSIQETVAEALVIHNKFLYQVLSDLVGSTIEHDDPRQAYLLDRLRQAESIAERIGATDEVERQSYRDILRLCAWAHIKLSGGGPNRAVGLAYLDKLEQLGDQDPTIPFMRGWLEAETVAGVADLSLEKRAEIRMRFEKALMIDPQFPEALWMLSQFRDPADVEARIEDRRKYLQYYPRKRPFLRLYKKDDMATFELAQRSIESWEAAQQRN